MTPAWWRPEASLGLERSVVEDGPDGFRISGTTLVVASGAGYEIRYSVLTDQDWHTRTVGAHLQGPDEDRRLALSADGKSAWFVGSEPMIDLFGALDVEFEWTPATYTLPIRRLGLAVGEAADVDAVHVSFPSRELTKVTRRYERLADSLYRSTVGGTTIDIQVDAHGRALDIADYWVRLPSP